LDSFSLADAQKAIAKRTVQKKENKIFDALADMKIKFRELSEWYLELKSVKKLKTHKRTKTSLANFNAIFGDKLLSEVNSIDLENYQEGRLEKGAAPATIDIEISIAKTMVNKAFKAGRFKINGQEIKIDGDLIRAFEGIKPKLAKGGNARERIVTVDEYLRLLEASAPHLRTMMVVAMNAGLRPGEIEGLKWSYIDKEALFIRLPAKATKEGKKTGRGKNVPINHRVKAVLDSKIRALHHDYVFMYKSEPLNGSHGVNKAFRGACKRAKIPYGRHVENGLTFHDFRRSVKTYMVQAGVDMAFRDLILGHSLKGMDIHYIKPTDEMLMSAIQKYTLWLDDQIGQELVKEKSKEIHMR